MANSLQNLLSSAAGNYLASSGLRAEIKTNLGPPVTIYNATPSGFSIADALGIQAALVVRDANGNVLASYGDPPATDPVLVSALALAFLATAVLLYKLIRR